MRFLIFLVPVIGLGIGFLLNEIWRRCKDRRKLAFVAPIIGGVLLWPLIRHDMRQVLQPKELGYYVAAMDQISASTPGDAIIWAWWDHGYSLNYWARRGTINDGSAHDGERTVYNGMPMASPSFRFAANFMRFYVVRGKTGIGQLYEAADGDKEAGMRLMTKILDEGPRRAAETLEDANLKTVSSYRSVDDWLDFFYPAEAPPVYLYLDQLMVDSVHWWYWFGTWDIGKKDGIHPEFIPLYRATRSGEQLLFDNDIAIDLTTGFVRFNRESYRPNYITPGLSRVQSRIPITILSVFDENRRRQKSYHERGMQLDLNASYAFAALTSPDFGQSVFNQLFVRHVFDRKYFRPLTIDTPIYQIWEVLGETR